MPDPREETTPIFTTLLRASSEMLSLHDHDPVVRSWLTQADIEADEARSPNG